MSNWLSQKLSEHSLGTENTETENTENILVKSLEENNLHTYFIKKFEDYFLSKNFEKHEPLKLTWEDKTTWFTSSAIVSLKKDILNWDRIPSYFITQTCIRTQNLDIEINEKIKYISSFNMIWAFVDKENYHIFIEQVWKFLQKELWYEKDEIKIYYDESHKTLIDWWRKLTWWPELISNNEWFNWKFWEWKIMTWNWFDFRVLNKEWEYTDIWNIMEVISNWEIKWYWLWLWLETLISHKNNYTNPIEFYTNKAWIKLNWIEDIHFYDSLKILIDSYWSWIKSWSKWANFQIKKTFKKINNILEKKPNLYLDLEKNIINFENSINPENNNYYEIFTEILKKSKFEISNKKLTIVVPKEDNISDLINKLKNIFKNIEYKLKDEYTWDNIWSNNKSLTFNLKFISKKWKTKNTFKQIVDKLKETFTIR